MRFTIAVRQYLVLTSLPLLLFLNHLNYMNFEELSFFYNKKSPIFLAEIVTLISCIILKTYSIEHRVFSQFVTIVMIVSASEIAIKTLGLSIWNRYISQKQAC